MDDLISRQAAIDAIQKHKHNVLGEREWDKGIAYGYATAHIHICDVIKNLPSAEQERWIPVKYRPMDEEERAYWSEHLGYDIECEDARLFDCKMPDDGQEILVSFRKFVSKDKCEVDCGCYGLEGNGDWDGVTAWMPLPEPYKGGADMRGEKND